MASRAFSVAGPRLWNDLPCAIDNFNALKKNRHDFTYPMVNESCKIECCGNKVNQIIQNMMLCQGLELKLSLLQGRTDPMGIRAMPWGPPPKGARQTSKNNVYQQKSVAKMLILHLIKGETFLEEECGPP